MAEMNFNRLLFSAGACLFFLYISFFLLRKENAKNDIFLASSSFQNEEEKVVKGVDCMGVGDVLDIKEFINSKEFEKMPFSKRNEIVLDYLYKESKKTYDCVLHENNTRHCFSFKDDVIYAKKKYRDEDMAMKYPPFVHI